MAARITRYRDFWPYYLGEHANPRTRAIHIFGTGLATLTLLALVVTGSIWLAPVALVAGYGPAWISHFFVEKNRPATFAYPFWSLISDYRMAIAWATGRLSEDLAKAGLSCR